MKSVKRFLALTVLSLLLAVTALGGDTPGPPKTPPPDPQTLAADDSPGTDTSETSTGEVLTTVLWVVLQLTTGR